MFFVHVVTESVDNNDGNKVIDKTNGNLDLLCAIENNDIQSHSTSNSGTTNQQTDVDEQCKIYFYCFHVLIFLTSLFIFLY